jgi:hypothetical protein
MNKIFFGIVGFIILMIIIVAILASGGGKKAPTVTGVTLKSLPNYSNTGATVSLTTQGRIRGDETYRSIRITVGEQERTVQIIQGYNGQVINSQFYPNNPAAYGVFLRSIGNSGFLARSKTKPASPNDERGQCPLGVRYVFELNQGTDELSRLWSSTCGLKVGTFGGNSSTIQTLFQRQIPDYSKFTSDVNL